MARYSTRSLLEQLGPKILLVVVAALFSLFSFWLVQSPVKYALSVFELVAIGILFLTVRKNLEAGRFLNFLRVIAERTFKDPYSDVVLIVFSLILIAVNAFHVRNVQEIQLFLSFLVASLLSGYSILKIFKITKYFSKLEILILSYIVAYIFSGSCTLGLLSIDESIRSIVIPFFYAIIGSVSLFLYIRTRGSNIHLGIQRTCSFSRKIDLLAIALAVAFYIIFYSFAYPNFTSLPGTDISRHFSNSLVLSRSPDLYAQRTNYLLFYAFEATLHTLSGPQQPVMSFLTIQVILNLFIPISVYALAKRFLGNIDTRIAPLSTIFFAIMSNFSFIYFTQLKLLNVSSSEIQLIGTEVAERSFNGTINFLQPFQWFVPISVSFIMFIVALLLLRVKRMPRTKFVPLCSVLLLAMYLTHPSEAIIFVVLLAVYGSISKATTRSDSLRINDVLLSSLVALVFAVVFTYYVNVIWKIKVANASLPLNVLIGLVFPLLFVTAAICWRVKVLPHLHFTMKFVKSNKLYVILSTSLVIIYLFGFQSWIFIDTFKTSTVYNSGVTPWFIYPLVLGIVGLLAILAIRYIPEIGPHGGLAFILVSIIIIFIFGRVVSFINVNYLITGYWEKRFLLFIFLLACLLAPISLIKLNHQLQVRVKRMFVTNCSLIVVLSLIVLVGFSSTILQSAYWFAVTSGKTNAPSKIETQAITFLRNILDRDPHAFVITPTEISKMNLAFSAPGYIFSMPIVLVTSSYPDVPLMGLSAHNLDHAYVYMQKRDFDFLKLQQHGWLGEHFLPLLPVVFSNEEVTIFNSSHVTYPASKSDNTMLIPVESPDNSWSYAYDIISQSGKNYSVMFDTDAHALKSKNVILSFDPSPVHYTFYDNFSIDNHYWSAISGTWQIVHSRLFSGDESGRLENILLSPVSSRIFKADTSFSVERLNPNVANYASIVYSYIDDRNYRYAGINIYNNSLYVYFAKVTDGKTSFYPAWPGMNTGLGWQQGERFNLTLVIDNKSRLEHLLLNSFEYLQQQYNGKSGRLGLSYGRMHDLAFTNFKVEDFRESNLRNVSDYLTYVNNGGHLFVINTNGYGIIADYLYKDQRKNVDNTNGDKNLSGLDNYYLPNNITRVSSNNSTIFSTSSFSPVESTIGRGKITYLDIHPMLLRYYEHRVPPANVFQIFGNLSSELPLSPLTTTPPNFKDFRGYFKEMLASGKTKVTTTSAIFPSDMQFHKVVITTDNQVISLINVTKLSLEKYDNVVLNTNNLFLGTGRGLYANVIIGANEGSNYSSVNISIPDKMETEIFATSDKGELLHISNVSKVELTHTQPIQMYVKQPMIDINSGNITLNELYPLELYARGQAVNKNLKIEGNATLSVIMSDSFTFLNNLTVDGNAQRTEEIATPSVPMVPFFSVSKLYSLPPLVRILLIIPFLLAAVFVLFGRTGREPSLPVAKT